MTEELLIINEETIKNKMYYIRGEYVMIDSDLAKIYGYTTKAFNQQVQRNIEKFDDDFMFQLTDEEVKIFSRSQNDMNPISWTIEMRFLYEKIRL